MLRLPSYLQRSRHGIFYFRKAVPRDLYPALRRRELKRSLRTASKADAVRAGRLLAHQTETLFEQLREQMKKTPFVNEFKVKGLKRGADGSVSVESIETDPNADPTTEMRMLDLLMEHFKAVQENGLLPNSTKAAESDESSTKLSLSQLVEDYCAEKQREGSWTPKSDAENRAIYALLIRILGDVNCGTITQQQANAAKQMLMSLPPRINTDKAYRDRSLKAILADEPSEQMSVSTVNKYLTRYSSLFEWGRRHGYVGDNYFEGLNLRKPERPDSARDAFTESDLKALFSAPIYTNLSYKHPYQYWTPLLALLTGARINELCQLHLADIREEEGIPVLDINASGTSKKLKRASTARMVPVHERLIELGFLRFVEKLRASGEERLFPELPESRDGYSKNASRWFNSDHKIACGVKDRKKVFHSFRHTVSTAFKHLDVPEGHAKAILGHQEESITYGRYGKAYPLATLKETVNRLTFEAALGVVKPFAAGS